LGDEKHATFLPVKQKECIRDEMTVIVDCHVHSVGKEKVEDVISAMDRGGIDKAIVFAPYPGQISERAAVDPNPTRYMRFSFQGVTEHLQEKSTKFISELQGEAPDKILAFAWIEPRLKNTLANIEEALSKFECKGIKMIPDHWHPYNPAFFSLYKKAEELGIPILFHSGILHAMKDSSRFCRPCNYEVLLNFPDLRFALAHASWPWTDECIALLGRFKANLEDDEWRDKRAKKMQMYIDVTPGTPTHFYRRHMYRNALSLDAEDQMIFGSDSYASDFAHAREVAEMDRSMIRELGYPDEVIQKIQARNIERFLKG